MAKRCNQIANVGQKLAEEHSVEHWRTDVTPWSALVEAGRREFGNAWVFYALAFVSTGLKIEMDTNLEFESLFDDDADLCQRAMLANRRAGARAWWEHQLKAKVGFSERTFILSLFFACSGPKTMVRLSSLADEVLQSLPEEWWVRLYMTLAQGRYWERLRPRKLILDLTALSSSLSPRFVVLVAGRLKKRSVTELCTKLLGKYDGDDWAVSQLRLDSAVRCIVGGGRLVEKMATSNCEMLQKRCDFRQLSRSRSQRNREREVVWHGSSHS